MATQTTVEFFAFCSNSVVWWNTFAVMVVRAKLVQNEMFVARTETQQTNIREKKNKQRAYHGGGNTGLWHNVTDL